MINLSWKNIFLVEEPSTTGYGVVVLVEEPSKMYSQVPKLVVMFCCLLKWIRFNSIFSIKMQIFKIGRRSTTQIAILVVLV